MMATIPQLSISMNFRLPYSDSRTHGYQGPTRNVRLLHTTPSGGGAVGKNEDGVRCAVAGKESLRILRISEPSPSHNPGHKSAVGRGGHRIDGSRNFWDGSGLKIDSASTDVAWCHGLFNNKILTSARNGELIMWDLNKSGGTKYERRTKDHIRSINKMSISHVVHHYCITGSADGDLRVWDLRDLSKSIMRVHHPTSVRSVVFSPSLWQPLQAIAGLDNGSIYRWDLKVGQRGQLDRLPVAHTASVTSLDWCNLSAPTTQGANTPSNAATENNGMGWFVSGGLDRCVKVWDLTAPGSNTHIPHKPTYTLYPSFPVRRVLWRPSYECELAVVPNADGATGSTHDVQHTGNSVSGLLTRVNSSLGLDAKLKAPPGHNYHAHEKDGSGFSIPDIKDNVPQCDAIEIWDVRRPWIAKWAISGSSSDGVVTDMAFGDSHAIWAQQSSGMFSQIDLRDAVKPLDEVPRVATTWEATGSMAFVVDKPREWEIPYDDLPSRQTAVETRKVMSKTLGDRPVRPTLQSVGTFSDTTSGQDITAFTRLSRKYIFHGHERVRLCEINAESASQAGQHKAAHVWLLMAVALTKYMVDDDIPRSPNRKSSAHPNSSPIQPNGANAPNTYSFPPNTSLNATKSTTLKATPSPESMKNHDHSTRIQFRGQSNSSSHKMTPVSSTPSSPHFIPSALPPVTPHRASFFARRESVDSGVSSSRRPSYRRGSVSVTQLTQSPSPIDKNAPSLRHVGEGALDDSDSDPESGEGEHTAGALSSDEGSTAPRHPNSPNLASTKAALSPLSRVAGRQHWTEDEKEVDKDEEDASSPSPRSTDTESGGSSSPERKAKSRRSSRRNSTLRLKSRSRSSTVASLAAPPISRVLAHQDSLSSIRTVTAVDMSLREQDSVHGIKPDETNSESRRGHHRQKSQTIPEGILNTNTENLFDPDFVDSGEITERRMDIVCAEEARYRELTWKLLREILEEFAEEGDVQMCAMLSIVAQHELHLPKRRVVHFIEGYIDLLERLRLYTCAAELRRYGPVLEISNKTLLETTIYTTCRKCRKPLLKPAGNLVTRGNFSFCLACKSSCIECSICRLPVKSLLFQCAVCNHGGHQSCYRKYYMEQPMIELPSPFLPPPTTAGPRGRPVGTPPTQGDDDSSSVGSTRSNISDSIVERNTVQRYRLAGHLCAAGCGHYCWVATSSSQDL